MSRSNPFVGPGSVEHLPDTERIFDDVVDEGSSDESGEEQAFEWSIDTMSTIHPHDFGPPQEIPGMYLCRFFLIIQCHLQRKIASSGMKSSKNSSLINDLRKRPIQWVDLHLSNAVHRW